MSTLAAYIGDGENVSAVAEADRLIERGVPVENIIKEGLVLALESLRDKCTTENFQLLDVLLSSRAMVEVIDQSIAKSLEDSMDVLEVINTYGNSKRGSEIVLVLGTILGDVHDLGKHLVATISRLSGIRVVNLGKDVSPEVFVSSAVKERADFVGVSSLMTVCLPTVNEIRPLLEQRGISPTIIAGGAAVQQAESGDLDVDYIAFDAFDAINYILNYVK